MFAALIICLVMLAVPVVLVAWGTSSRRVTLVCTIIGVCAFGLASVSGEVDVGPHVEIPGWIVGCIYVTLLMLSCGLCVAVRRDFRGVKQDHEP
jgi:hypothetical protein